jgi:Tol biopolymer transport system component
MKGEVVHRDHDTRRISGKRVMFRARTLRIAVAGMAAVVALLPPSTGATIEPATGRLLVVNVWSPPNLAGTRAQILAVDRGHASVLAQERRYPYVYSALTLSPNGKQVAYISVVGARMGVWVMGRDGSNRHRLVAPPHSPCGNGVSINQVVWAPSGNRLAYTADIGGDTISVCGKPDVFGTWVTALNHPAPRKVSDLIGGLSWSPRARTLLIIPGFGLGPEPGSLRNTGGLVAVDAQTGHATMLLRARFPRLEFHGQFAPVTGTLGYSLGVIPGFVVGGHFPRHSVIWAAGAQGKHRHRLGTVPGVVTSLGWSPDGRSLAVITEVAPVRWGNDHSGQQSRMVNAGARSMWVVGAGSPRPRELVVNAHGPILGPAWSPDGRQVAYIGGQYASTCVRSYIALGCSLLYGTAIYSVDVATGQQRVFLSGDQRNGPMLRPVQLTSLAWSR